MSNDNLEKSIKYLDEIDISEALWSDRSVAEAMEEVDAIYGTEYERLHGGSLFGGWTEDDFASYIRKEYGLKCYERSLLFIK